MIARLSLRVIALLLFALSSATVAPCLASSGKPASSWTIDETSSVVHFITRQRALISCRGTFKGITGTVRFDGSHPSRASVKARIQLDTIKSGITTRDRDLKSYRYMDVEKFPYASFDSQKIEATKDGYVMHGYFQLHGIRAPIDVTFSKPEIANDSMHVKGSATVLEHVYALSLKPLHPEGFVWINDPIEINLDITANRPKRTPASACK